MPAQFKHSAETRQIIKAHWLNERSASWIAAEMGLGFTRNAVIGVVNRLGLPLRDKKAKRDQPPPRPHLVPILERRPVVVAKRERRPSAAIKPKAPPMAAIPVSPPSPVTLFNLRNGLCRFPNWADDEYPDVWTSTYCGAACGIDTYCAAHQRLTGGAGVSAEKRPAVADRAVVGGAWA